MRRQTVLAVALAALVALGGCSALDGSAETPEPTETETSEPFVGPNESVGGDELADRHENELRMAGSFTVATNLTFGDSENAASETTELRADIESDTYRERTDAFRTVERDRYTTGETTYRQTTSDDHVSYDVAGEPYDGDLQPVDVSESLHLDTIRMLFDGEVDLQNRGTTSHEGRTVTEFTASGVDSWDPPGYDTSNVTEFEVTALVDRDGVVRHLSYRIVEERDNGLTTLQMEMSVGDVGSTDVTEPDWLDEAESGSD